MEINLTDEETAIITQANNGRFPSDSDFVLYVLRRNIFPALTRNNLARERKMLHEKFTVLDAKAKADVLATIDSKLSEAIKD